MKCFSIAFALVFSLGCFLPEGYSQKKPTLHQDSLDVYVHVLDTLSKILPEKQYDSLQLEERLPNWIDNQGLGNYILKIDTRTIHGYYLLIVCGFCAFLLLFLWWSTKEFGVFWLSMALLCWAFSGCVMLLMGGPEEKIGIAIFSTLNSICLLLMISHLDKEDLPNWIQEYISARYLRSGIALVLVLYVISFIGGSRLEPYDIDLAFTVITLLLLFFSFIYLFTKRVSLLVAVMSGVALLTTLVVHLIRADSIKSLFSIEISALQGTILNFSYKPLLIVTFFVLIISWLWKRLKTNDAYQAEAKNKIQMAHEVEIARLLAHWEKEKQEIEKKHEAALEMLRHPLNLEENRKKYPKLDDVDWKIVEAFAKGDKMPAIEKALSAKKDSLNWRTKRISEELGCHTTKQMDIVKFAMSKGVLGL